LKEIEKVARVTTATLAEYGLECCLFGSTACAMYGASRVPNVGLCMRRTLLSISTTTTQDVDVIVLNLWTSWDVEDVKQLLERENENFFLVPSTNPRNTYQVLWYSLSTRNFRACKVDILVPGTVDIPQIPISSTTYTSDRDRIPLVPFMVLLLLKLRGWDDHRNHHRQDMIDKQHVDVQDINELLGMCNDEDHLSNESWLPKWFIKKSRKRVRQYVNSFPNSANDWRSIGFEV